MSRPKQDFIDIAQVPTRVKTIAVKVGRDSANQKKKPVKITTDNKCSFCTGSKCCQYITSSIDSPRSIRDYDFLLWQISHRNIHIFKDKGGWYLIVYQQCEHLESTGRCSIYEKRPFICREHDNKECEFNARHDEGCDLYFRDYHSLDQYCRGKFKSWDNRFSKN
ncbi:YkgJ family cysteine cluster protein [Aliikangiella sp. G2MR2-5]|uniref:YkgJ family cysteine cluster protein n=1 Tax=Aliikangiella sp. G2MR2-5 TaxID=2788943 RepID=UPI0018AB7A61|nr:YkgJ family cysteine cluster protein [Aliikangiella sp. G2MR2-5]